MLLLMAVIMIIIYFTVSLLTAIHKMDRCGYKASVAWSYAIAWPLWMVRSLYRTIHHEIKNT